MVLVLLVRRGLIPLRLRVMGMGVLLRRPSRRDRGAVKLARRLRGARRANAFRRVAIVFLVRPVGCLAAGHLASAFWSVSQRDEASRVTPTARVLPDSNLEALVRK